jgi:hypothetical protein
MSTILGSGHFGTERDNLGQLIKPTQSSNNKTNPKQTLMRIWQKSSIYFYQTKQNMQKAKKALKKF